MKHTSKISGIVPVNVFALFGRPWLLCTENRSPPGGYHIGITIGQPSLLFVDVLNLVCSQTDTAQSPRTWKII